MKLATLPKQGSPDGQLVVVSADLQWAAPVPRIAGTMQQALENWAAVVDDLRRVYSELNENAGDGRRPFDASVAMAPLPRAWQWLDGSAFASHGELMARVFGREAVVRERPLMYQGLSYRFFAPTEDVPFRLEEDGIDFEGEFGIVTDEVPMGVSPEEAGGYIRLVLIVNDWSLRKLSPVEMSTGFGWVQAKPPCSASPVAVTPDELGAGWRDFRVCLPLLIDWNEQRFGSANGSAMQFGFHDLVAHAAATRSLVAGTIIGSGTVSNANFREVGSSCIGERRGIETLDSGAPSTGFMRFGDTVRMEAIDADGRSVFGAIEQKIVQA